MSKSKRYHNQNIVIRTQKIFPLKEKLIKSLLTITPRKIILLVVLLLLLCGLIYWKNMNKPTLYTQYSPGEVATYWEMQKTLHYDITDYILRKDDDIILIDLRSKEEYDKEHIMGAMNIPVALKKDDPSSINNEQEVRQAFKKLDKKKEIVIYGENKYSSIPLKTATLVTDAKVPVRVMNMGWNEFRHFPTFWMPEKLWGKADITNFIDTNQL